MVRQTPNDLRKISSDALARKRQAQLDEKRLASANKQATKAIAAQSRQSEREQNDLKRWILEATMSSQHELEIENPTASHLHFLVENGIEHGFALGSSSPHPTDAKTLQTLVDQIKEQIDHLQDQFDNDLFDLGESVHDWVFVNQLTAFQASLEPWFGEDLDEYWSFDTNTADELLSHIVLKIKGSRQPGKVQVLQTLKGLVEKQLSADKKYRAGLSELNGQLKFYQSALSNLRGQAQTSEVNTDVVYWVSWKNLKITPKNSNQSFIALLEWANDHRGRASLKLIDNALLRKASAGEHTAEFTVVQKDTSKTKGATDTHLNYHCSLDGREVLQHAPSADMFCLLMQAAGYKSKLKRKQNAVWQATVSW